MKKLVLLVCLCFGFIGVFAQTTYTVGAGKTYTTFDAAITALNATNPLPAGGIIYNIDASFSSTENPRAIVLTAANNDATHPIIFQVNNGVVTSSNHAVVKPGTGTTTPNSPVTNNAGIEIVGADYITFNGVDVTIALGSTLKYGYYLRNASVNNGAQHNTIKNSKITLNRATASGASVGIYQNTASSPASVGGANSYNVYDGISVTNTYRGIALNNSNTSWPDINCEVLNCIIGSGNVTGDIGSTISTNFAGPVGIEATNMSGVSIHDCEVKNVGYYSSNSGIGKGIWLQNASGTSSIYKNSIHDIVGYRPSTSDIIHGVSISTVNAAAIVNMYNNFLYNIFTSGSLGGPQLFGLNIDGVANSFVNVYFNSIYMSTPSSTIYSSLTLNYGSAAVSTSNVKLNIQNNIIKVDLATGSSKKHYGVYYNSGSFNSSNYNNYDMATTGSGGQYYTGYKSGDVALIGAWRTATGSDANSKQMTTSFKSIVAGSIDLHLQFAACTLDPTYQGVFINGVYPAITGLDSVDIDYSSLNPVKRTYPFIGADEVEATADVTISPNQPLVGTVAKNETNQVLYNVIVTANNADAIFQSITVITGSDNPPGYSQNTQNDFKNFKVWIDSINGTYNSVTSKQLISTGPGTTVAPSIGGTLTFSATNLYTLTKCKTYYVFVTADIGAVGVATSGDNINLNNTTSNFTFSNPVKATSSTGASGYQYIVDKYYNFPLKDVNYSSTWYVPIPPYLTAADTIIYTGDFTEPYHTFQMITNPVDSMETPWVITGTLSKLIVGNNLVTPTAVKFNVQQTYTGTADVLDNANIVFKTASIPTTLGTLATGSTVTYDSAFNQTVITANYYNLVLTGTRGANSITLPNTTVGVAAQFTSSATFGGGNYVHAGASSTITFNGNIQQRIKSSFNFNIFNINNTSANALSITTPGSETGCVSVDSGVTISAATSYTYTAGNLVVRGTGTINNSSNSFTAFAAGYTTSTLAFGSGSNYILSGTLTSTAGQNGQIPAATWHAASNLKITSVTSATQIGAVGAPTAAGYGNFIYDNGSVSTGSMKLFTGFSGTTTIQGTLTLLRTNGSQVQIFTSSGATTIIASYVNLNCGNWLFNNGTYTLTVQNDFRIVDSMSAVSGYSIPTLSFGSSGTGTMNVAGKFVFTATTNTPVITTVGNTGTIVFNGSAAQTITSNSAGNMLTVSSGTLASTLNNAAGLTLVSGRFNPTTLTFGTGGLFTVPSGSILNPGATAGYTSAKYVITTGTGIIKQAVPLSTNWTFPVGTSTTSYNPLILNYTNGAADSFAVNLLPTYTYPPAMPSFVVNTQYDITKHSGGTVTNATLTMQWNVANEASGFQRTNSPLVIGHYTAGAWVETSTLSAAVGAGPYTTTATGFTSFSPFGPGNCSAFGPNLGCTLLPVDLLSFSGKANGSISQLVWKTTREVNVKEFTVERGLDGSHFDGIGNIAAKNISGQNEYGFDDKSVPVAGIVYYRLKIISNDGQSKYSQVIALNFKKAKGTVEIFPNPVRNSLFITHEKAVAGSSVTIYTAAGSKAGEYVVTAGATQTTVNTASLPAGIYSLKYQNNGLVQIVRFAKL